MLLHVRVNAQVSVEEFLVHQLYSVDAGRIDAQGKFMERSAFGVDNLVTVMAGVN